MIREVVFREEVNLQSTTYATHGLYFYPAKFIPHVVRYAIEKYSKVGDTVFDPFAGHGTVAIEASILGRNAICWDLNPLTDLLTRASTYSGNVQLADFDLDWDYDEPFEPQFSNIMYWYPREFYEVLSRAWGFWHKEIFACAKTREEIEKAYLLSIPLLRLSKLFSYADEKVPKLYKSKLAVKKVEKFLSNDWRKLMFEMYNKFAKECLEKVLKYQEIRNNPLLKNEVSISVSASKKVGGALLIFDVTKECIGQKVELLITSPPYLQSQEYIRTFKLELAWLGYNTQDLRELSKHEIPYNNPQEVDIFSNTFFAYRKQIEGIGNNELLELYDKYFYSIIGFFENNLQFLNNIAVFVGRAKIRNIRIPIDVILQEHLEKRGFTHVETIADKIVSRRLFKTELNPATKLQDERTPTEYLLIMSKA